MTQSMLRRRIAALESLQGRRIELVAQQKRDLDAVVEKEARRIENLKQQLTMGVAQ